MTTRSSSRLRQTAPANRPHGRSHLRGEKAMRTLLFSLLLAASLHATSRTWTGLSGVDLNWSTAGNWSPSGVPVAADALTFDNTCTNCNSTIDTTVTVTSLTLAATYVGTLTESATLTLTGAFSMAGGTFAAGS